MSWAEWNTDARRLLEVDRDHRKAKQSGIMGRQLVPVGKISRFMTVAFAIGIGSLLALDVDSDVPLHVVAITGVMLASFAPFAGVWTKLTEFERLHAPPAGLLLLRLRRLSPYLALIAAVWGSMLFARNGSGLAIAAVVAMPFVMSLANMLRAEYLGYFMRVAITTTFLLGWMRVVDWLPAVTLALDVVVVLWFVRDLGVYDREGFVLDSEAENRHEALDAEIAAERVLPDVRETKRRSLFGSAIFLLVSSQRQFAAYWRRRPVTVTWSCLIFTAGYLLPVWMGMAAVWMSDEGVAAMFCIMAALFSMTMGSIEASEQLYLWGVDMRDVQRHNLLARLLTVVLPSVAAAVMTVFLVGESDLRWTAVGLLFALHLARIGLGAFNFGTAFLMFCIIGIAFIVTGGGSAMDPDKALCMAVVLAVFGLVGCTIRMFRSEGALRKNAFA